MPKALSKQKGQLRWLFVTVFIFILDQVTKFSAVSYLIFAKPVSIFPGFNLTLIYNYGSAFSFLDNKKGWQTIFFALIALIAVIVILFWLAKLKRSENIFALALCLIAGGALGNLYDRLSYGYVIDFIDVYYKSYHWPIFNIADSAICVGAFLIILKSFKKK